jgi:predicted molibdopterin-dependent oxidoreductase YjgC
VTTEIGTADRGVGAVKSGELSSRLRESQHAVLIWSGPGGRGGTTVAGLAAELGFADKPGCGAFHLLETANGRGVADAWAAASDAEEADPEPIELLFVSGDEAAANPDVRALAERSSKVLAISMFRSPVAGWADLVLPGTSYLERDGTYMNVEGRLQRLRRAVIPPCPDELAWLAKLAERFGVSLSPYPSQVFAELSELAYGGLDYGGIGEQSTLPPRPDQAEVPSAAAPAKRAAKGKGLRLLTYRPLFSGPAVERVPELQFQRPAAEIELSPDDAKKLGVEAGSPINVRSNGTSVALRARVNRKLVAGVARVASEHAEGLGTHVEVRK